MVILVDSAISKGLVTIDLGQLLPDLGVKIIDVQEFMGGSPLLKESIFRRELQGTSFADFGNALVGFSNRQEHILPQWAAILLAVKFEQNKIWTTWGDTKEIVYGHWLLEHLARWDTSPYQNKRISLKGCSEYVLSPEVYMAYARKLSQCAKAVSFGEKCALVPISKDVSL